MPPIVSPASLRCCTTDSSRFPESFRINLSKELDLRLLLSGGESVSGLVTRGGIVLDVDYDPEAEG